MPASPALHPQNQRQQPTKTGSPQEPGKSLAVEMTRGGTRGKVLPRLFHRSHRTWKSRNKRGIPTFPQPRRRRVKEDWTNINTKINTKINNKTKVVYTDNLTHPDGNVH